MFTKRKKNTHTEHRGRNADKWPVAEEAQNKQPTNCKPKTFLTEPETEKSEIIKILMRLNLRANI